MARVGPQRQEKKENMVINAEQKSSYYHNNI
jgi:hypothetical protein